MKTVMTGQSHLGTDVETERRFKTAHGLFQPKQQKASYFRKLSKHRNRGL